MKTSPSPMSRFAAMDPEVRKRLEKALKRGGGTIQVCAIREIHTLLYGPRPNRKEDASADPSEWDTRLNRDVTRARRAGVLAKRDGEVAAAPTLTGTGRRSKILGRDDVLLWGRPFPKEAAFAIVRALGNKWGPDPRISVRKCAIAQALVAHGYTFDGSAIDGFYGIVDPKPTERAKIADKIAALQRKLDELPPES